jgi:hypothetical protein
MPDRNLLGKKATTRSDNNIEQLGRPLKLKTKYKKLNAQVTAANKSRHISPNTLSFQQGRILFRVSAKCPGKGQPKQALPVLNFTRI